MREAGDDTVRSIGSGERAGLRCHPRARCVEPAPRVAPCTAPSRQAIADSEERLRTEPRGCAPARRWRHRARLHDRGRVHLPLGRLRRRGRPGLQAGRGLRHDRPLLDPEDRRLPRALPGVARPLTQARERRATSPAPVRECHMRKHRADRRDLTFPGDTAPAPPPSTPPVSTSPGRHACRLGKSVG